VNHEAPPGTPPGLGSVTMFMSLLAGAFSDQRWTIEQVIAEGDLVAIHCIHSGRHTGDYFGLPATGRQFAYKQMHMIKMRNGKGVEHW
ncbi:ester cyclase, partial [Rhizobium johnstonii]